MRQVGGAMAGLDGLEDAANDLDERMKDLEDDFSKWSGERPQ